MLAIALFISSLATVYGQFDCHRLQIQANDNQDCPSDIYLPHIFQVEWSKSSGWSEPEITEIKSVKVHPSAKALQRGVTVFNGVQLRLDPEGNVRVFKLNELTEELRKFGLRLGFPEVDPKDLKCCIQKLLFHEKTVLRRQCQHPFNSVDLRVVLTANTPNVELVPPDGVQLFAYN